MCPNTEFKVNGLGGHVTVTHRDIEMNGFPEALHGLADGLFLDLPKPHLVGLGGRRADRAAGEARQLGCTSLTGRQAAGGRAGSPQLC
jgi:hypothetical protein